MFNVPYGAGKDILWISLYVTTCRALNSIFSRKIWIDEIFNSWDETCDLEQTCYMDIINQYSFPLT